MTGCSWLICGITLCKISQKGLGLKLLGTHSWATVDGWVPRSAAYALFFLPTYSHILCPFVEANNQWATVSSPKMENFMRLFLPPPLIPVMPYNSAHHCVVEVENFLFVLGGEDQWNPNGNYWTQQVCVLWKAPVAARFVFTVENIFLCTGTNETVGKLGWQLEGGSTIELAEGVRSRAFAHWLSGDLASQWCPSPSPYPSPEDRREQKHRLPRGR